MASSSQFNLPLDSSSSTSSSSIDESSSEEEDQHIARDNTLSLLITLPLVTRLLESVKKRRRRHIARDRQDGHRQICRDYFDDNCTYPADYFRRRYRMRKELFLCILKDVEACDNYFVQKRNCAKRLGCSSIQKMTAAIRILAYGLSSDHCDEYIKIGESTAIESMKRFCEAVISLYEGQYLRSPNEHDIARLLQEGKERGFPGSHNDINVLDHSPLFDTLIHGQMPPVNYEVNGRPYTMGYYLSDGIYPPWATLMQTLKEANTGKELLFKKKQEAVRKDVERAFGVLQARWAITQGAARFWEKDDLCLIMKTCIILHNMIIEDERDIDVESWKPPEGENISLPEYTRDEAFLTSHVVARLRRIRNRGTNSMLRDDLMEHLWSLFGNEQI